MGTLEMATDGLIRELEMAEIAAQRSFYQAASDGVRARTRLQTLDLGTAFLGAIPSVDALALNRVIGLGLDGPITAAQIEEIRAAFQSFGTKRFFLQLAPFVEMTEASAILEEQGFRHYNNWVRLVRSTESTPPVASTDLRVRSIGPAEAHSFGMIAADAFEWSSDVARMVAGLVGKPGWGHFMAFDGHKPVATGAIYTAGPCGWMDFAATRPEYRGRGAQKALLTQRIREAIALGCKSVTVETAEERPDRPSPSYQNMMRYGFKEVYHRPNYIYEF